MTKEVRIFVELYKEQKKRKPKITIEDFIKSENKKLQNKNGANV